MTLPPLLSVPEIQNRLQIIFPEGTTNRKFVIREMAGKTVFVMLYTGAIEGNERWLRPDQVTRMTDAQTVLTDEHKRQEWNDESMKPAAGNIEGCWYAVNTRESIRDETLRDGLMRTGAVEDRKDLPTTSSKPRYALAQDFAALFHPGLEDDALENAINAWRATHLTAGALARITAIRHGAVESQERVLITFPSGETRQMEPGPSSVISKAVIEEFLPRFLERPGVIWLSESSNQVVARDDQLAKEIGLTIHSDRTLPDMILLDLGPDQPLLVFVEVVATAGHVSEARQTALMEIAKEGGFNEDQVAFVTAYADRNNAAFRNSVSELAWRSFVWFRSEPDHIMVLHRGTDTEHVSLWHLTKD